MVTPNPTFRNIILWLCNRISVHTDYYDCAKAKIQTEKSQTLSLEWVSPGIKHTPYSLKIIK